MVNKKDLLKDYKLPVENISVNQVAKFSNILVILLQFVSKNAEILHFTGLTSCGYIGISDWLLFR